MRQENEKGQREKRREYKKLFKSKKMREMNTEKRRRGEKENEIINRVRKERKM